MRDSALLDCVHGFVPGWRLPRLPEGALATGRALPTDSVSEVLGALRDERPYEAAVQRRVRISGGHYRDRVAIRRLATGYMRLLFPGGDCTTDELRTWYVEPAIRLRQLVRDQLHLMDTEYEACHLRADID